MRYFFRRGWLLSAAAGLLVAGCQPKPAAESASAGVPNETMSTDTCSVAARADGITTGLLKQHTQILASDAFQGRRPFTAGEKKAAGHLAAGFRKLGLQPGRTPGGNHRHARLRDHYCRPR